tara:strand:+ start:1051 stop:1521 length:471 start_codon:yes stop_codon:yes gene_type:complete
VEGALAPSFILSISMISVSKVRNIASRKIEQMNCFLVNVSVTNLNNIKIIFDSSSGVSLNDCINLTKFIENSLDREKEDFSISVSSPGVNSPFIVPDQFYKNYNNKIEILTKEGIKINAKLLMFSEQEETVTILTKNGRKKKYELSELKKIKRSKV